MGKRNHLGWFAGLILSTSLVAGCGEPSNTPDETAQSEAQVPVETLEAPSIETNASDDNHHPAVEGRGMAAITEDVHNALLTIDTHVDIPDTFATDEVDPGARGRYQVDLVKMKEGNLNAVFFIVYVGQKERTEANYQEAMSKARNKFDAIHRMTDDLYGDQIELP